jgi:hypothetical protein
MGSGKKKGGVPEAAGELPTPFNSYRGELKAILENSAEVLRRALSEAQLSLACELRGVQSGQSPADKAGAALQPIMADAVGEAFKQAQELLNRVGVASQEAQAAMQTPPTVAPQAAAAVPPPAPEQPPPTPPVNPFDATNILMSQAVGSLDAAVQAAIQTVDIHPGKAGTWEAQSPQERRGRQ